MRHPHHNRTAQLTGGPWPRTCACQPDGYLCANADRSCPCVCHGASPLAGTTYPMPPVPKWAATSNLGGASDATIDHFGYFLNLAEMNEDGEVGGTEGVQVQRYDVIDATSVTVGPTVVLVGSIELAPSEARKLASLLIQAAATAEQS
jgi:hypothetical protein